MTYIRIPQDVVIEMRAVDLNPNEKLVKELQPIELE